MKDKTKTILMFAILMVKTMTGLDENQISIMEVEFDDESNKNCYYIHIRYYNHKVHRTMFLRTSLLRKTIESYIHIEWNEVIK